MTWLSEKMGVPPSPSHAHADRALRMSDEVIIQSRSLRQQLAPFKESIDPFMAIRKAASTDGDY